MKTSKTFKIIVPDVKKEIIPVKTSIIYCDCIEDIMTNAARVVFYGLSGWEEAWPLTFHLYTDSGIPMATAEIFILSPAPHFDPIIVKPDFNKMKELYEEYN